MKKLIIFLLFFSVVFLTYGKKIAEFDDIFKLRNFKIDGKDLYVVDGYEIKLFSIKDARLITTFGRRGEGPGEFPRHPRIDVSPEDICVVDFGKILFFNRDGKYIHEKKTSPFLRYHRVKQNFLVKEYKRNKNKGEKTFNMKILDRNFNNLKTLYVEKTKSRSYNASDEIEVKIDMNAFPKIRIPMTDGEYIYVFDTNKGFYIEIYDHNGLKLNTIHKEFMKLPVTDQDRKDFMIRLKENKYWERIKNRFNFIFPEYFPDIQLVSGDREKLYVMTYKKVNEKMEVIILNQKGKILKKAYIPKMRYHLFHKNKYYYFIDNEEDEVWELHMVNL